MMPDMSTVSDSGTVSGRRESCTRAAMSSSLWSAMKAFLAASASRRLWFWLRTRSDIFWNARAVMAKLSDSRVSAVEALSLASAIDMTCPSLSGASRTRCSS